MPLIAARATAVVGVLVVAAGVAVGLAGCSPDEATPTATTSAPLTTTPAATPTPTPTQAMPTPAPSPTLPVEWQDDGEAGAEEAARYFLDLYAYTKSTQDTTAWEAISDPDCVFCQSVMTGVADDIKAGQVGQPGPIVVTSLSVEELSPGAFEVTAAYTAGPAELRSRDGDLLETWPAADETAVLFVLRVEGSWVLRAVSEHG